MAAKENRGKQFFAGKTFQIKGRIFYAHLLAPKLNKEGTRKYYTTMFAWKPEENPQVSQALRELMAQTKQQFHPTIPEQFWVNPIKHYDYTARTDGKAHPDFLKGHHWVNANANEAFAPKIIKQDPNMPGGIKQLSPLDDAEVYSGRNAVISISFWLLEGQKNGVSVNLEGVLLLDGGEKVVVDAGIDPSQAFASFLGNMGMPAAQPAQQYAQQYAQPAPQQFAQSQQYAQPAQQPAAQTNGVGGMPNMPWNNGQGNNGGGLV